MSMYLQALLVDHDLNDELLEHADILFMPLRTSIVNLSCVQILDAMQHTGSHVLLHYLSDHFDTIPPS